MIEAYLDESGIHNQAAICVVGGFFGGKGQLRRLEKAWRKTLARFRFPLADFHAKDLIKSRKHQPMLSDLAQVIAKERTVRPVAWGIVVDDFNSFSLEQRRFMTGATLDPKSKRLTSSGCPKKPYFVPFQNVLRLVTKHAPVGGKARFNFGVDRPFAEYARVLFRQIDNQAKTGPHAWSTWDSMDRLGSPLFPKASETPQLQAADLLVHLTYLHLCEWLKKGRVIEPSGLLLTCISNLISNEYCKFQDRECLEQLLEESRHLVGDWNGVLTAGQTP